MKQILVLLLALVLGSLASTLPLRKLQCACHTTTTTWAPTLWPHPHSIATRVERGNYSVTYTLRVKEQPLVKGVITVGAWDIETM
jgi:hypothetical protein